jgi:hypothetical protein
MKFGRKEVAVAALGGRAIATIRYGAKLVWEAIRANFLTKEGLYIETRDGKIFDSKQD